MADLNRWIVRPTEDRDWMQDLQHINTELQKMYALVQDPPRNPKEALLGQITDLINFVQRDMIGMDEVDFGG